MLNYLSLLCFLIMSIVTVSFADEPTNDFDKSVVAYQKKDYFTAFDLVDNLCKNGNVVACNNLGYLYDHGYGIRQSYQKALDIYMKLCDQNFAVGCFNVGAMYVDGSGVKADRKKALNFIGKACDLRDAFSCKQYSVLNVIPLNRDILEYIHETNRGFVSGADEMVDGKLMPARYLFLRSRRFLEKE